jgi:hypothetical protein
MPTSRQAAARWLIRSRTVRPSGAVAHHQDQIFAHVGGKEVTAVRNLTVVAQKQPAAGEDPLQILPINLRLDKDSPADKAALVIDQMAEICRLRVSLHVSHLPERIAGPSLLSQIWQRCAATAREKV